MKKKLFALLLVLVLCVSCVLVACDKTPDDNTDGRAPADKLAAAKDVLYLNYKDSIPAETAKDFTLTKSVPVDGIYYFPVTWTVNTDKITVDPVDDIQIKINVPERSPEEIVYILTATITADNGDTETVTFERTVPLFDVLTYQGWIDACVAGAAASDNTKTYNVVGYVVGVNADASSSSVGSLWIMDKDGHGYYAYKPQLSDEVKASRESINAYLPIGTEVIINGTVTVYNGAYEFNSGCTIEKTGNTAAGDGVTFDYVDRSAAFAASSKDLGDDTLIPYQSTYAKLENITLGNVDGDLTLYFTIGDDNRQFICYNNVYLMDNDTMEAFKAKWVANIGGKADIKGIVNVYGGKYQIYPSSLDCLEIITLSDEEKVAGVKKALTLDSKYMTAFTLPTSELVKVSWTVTGEGATIGENNQVTLNQTNEDQTVTFTATITSGTVTETKNFTVTIGALAETFIKKALAAAEALEDGATTTDSYMIIGTVSEITATYNEQYKNVSFKVSDGSFEVLVDRYNLDDAKDIKVGDKIAIAAPMKKYGTTLEAVATFVKLDVTDIDVAAAAGIAGTGVAGTTVYGQVTKIGSAYSSQYKNITVTISDGTNEIDCYRMTGGEDLKVGDYILVTGTPSAFNSKARFAQGATYVKDAIYVAPVTKAELVNNVKDITLTDYATMKASVTEQGATSTDTYYTIGYVSSITNSTFGNMVIEDAEGNTLNVYGTYGFDGKVRFDKLPTQPEVGDVVVLKGKMNNYSGTIQLKNAWILQIGTDVCVETSDYIFAQISVSESVDADFTLSSLATWTIKEGTAITLDGNKATVTRGKTEATVVLTATIVFNDNSVTKDYTVVVEAERVAAATFTFGENGAATHNDGTAPTTDYTETSGNYTLTIEQSTTAKFYTGAYDAKGNSALKLGTTNAVGGFSFTVAEEDVKEVVIYVAKYKNKDTTVKINDKEYSVSKASDNGEYMAIVVDVSTNKTVKVETVSGKSRCMIDRIEYVQSAAE